jgi:hypothetical protein
MSDQESDPFETQDGLDDYWYDEATRSYWLKNTSGSWIDLGTDGMRRHLKKLGKRDKPNVQSGELISQVDEVLSYVEKEKRVAYAGVLAGYKAGLHRVTGRTLLVTEDPILIDPQKGEFPMITAFIDGLLIGKEVADDEGNFVTYDQRPYFFGWLQHALECLYSGRTDPGLMLAMAGEPNCGKSFLALFLRWSLGGRVAKPYAVMTGQDNFNRDTVEAVLQLVDDENQADTRLDLRQKFGAEVKKIVANNEVRLRAMHKDGFAVEVLRRLVVLVNLQGIQVLPPLDGDVDDKLIILKGYARPAPKEPITADTPAEQACWPAPMPTRTIKEKEAYRDRIRGELPAFLFWLLYEFKIPSHASGGRFVVRHWHHPAIVSELHDLSPHTRLWDLIVGSRVVFSEYRCSEDTAAEWIPRKEWRGTAKDLDELLKKNDASRLSADERREVPSPVYLGRRLRLCTKHFGEEFCRLEIKRTSKTWILRPRPQDLVGGAS